MTKANLNLSIFVLYFASAGILGPVLRNAWPLYGVLNLIMICLYYVLLMAYFPYFYLNFKKAGIGQRIFLSIFLLGCLSFLFWYNIFLFNLFFTLLLLIIVGLESKKEKEYRKSIGCEYETNPAKFTKKFIIQNKPFRRAMIVALVGFPITYWLIYFIARPLESLWIM